MTMPRLDIPGHALANATRARMLCAMMDGRAWTNKELAADAGVTPQTASAHLHLLRQAGLIGQRRSGRCLYHRIVGPEVAAMLEQVARLAPADHLHRAQRCKAGGLAGLRCCYDHMAGAVAVALCDSLLARGALRRDGGGLIVLDSSIWARLGVVLPACAARRALCARPCLDWTERREHLAGPVGRAILAHARAEGWVLPGAPRRGLRLTAPGRAALAGIAGLAAEMLADG